MISAHDSTDLDDFDYRGKALAIFSHVTRSKIDRLPDQLKKYAKPLPDGQFKVRGFLLGTVVDYSVYGQVWVKFSFAPDPVQVSKSLVLRIIPDDEALPVLIGNMPLLILDDPT